MQLPKGWRSSSLFISLRWDAIILVFTILPFVLAFFGLTDVALVMPLVLLGLVVYRLYRLRLRKPDPTDMRYLLQRRALVSVEDPLLDEERANQFSGRITFVYEVRRIHKLTGIVVQLDSPLWVAKVTWPFLLLRPLTRNAGFENLSLKAQMRVSVSLATQGHLNRMRGRVRGVRVARANPMVPLGHGRVSLPE